MVLLSRGHAARCRKSGSWIGCGGSASTRAASRLKLAGAQRRRRASSPSPRHMCGRARARSSPAMCCGATHAPFLPPCTTQAEEIFKIVDGYVHPKKVQAGKGARRVPYSGVKIDSATKRPVVMVRLPSRPSCLRASLAHAAAVNPGAGGVSGEEEDTIRAVGSRAGRVWHRARRETAQDALRKGGPCKNRRIGRTVGVNRRFRSLTLQTSRPTRA